MGRGIVLKKASVSSRDTYRKHYRNKENPPVPKGSTIKDYGEYLTMMASIGKAIAYGITETHGGVRLRGLGYFTVTMKPFKTEMLDTYKGDAFVNTHSDFYIYRATFVPNRIFHPIKDFVIEGSMYESVKQRLMVQIKHNQFKYRTYLHTFMKARQHQNVKTW